MFLCYEPIRDVGEDCILSTTSIGAPFAADMFEVMFCESFGWCHCSTPRYQMVKQGIRESRGKTIQLMMMKPMAFQGPLREAMFTLAVHDDSITIGGSFVIDIFEATCCESSGWCQCPTCRYQLVK